MTTDQTGTELQDELFYPWGQDWTRAGQPYVMHFAGMQGFENPGLVYPTDFRKYNPALGRWMSPDQAGMAAADPSNPQSWNSYAYVTNSPTSFIDPLGLASHCHKERVGWSGEGTWIVVCDDPDSVTVTGDPGGARPDQSQNLNSLPGGLQPGGASGPAKVGPGGDGGGGSFVTRAFARLNCAVNFGDEHSIAAGIYAGKGKPDFVTNLFLGNAVSAIGNLFLFVSGKKMPTGADAATVVLSGGGQGVPGGGPGMKGAAGIAQDAAVGAIYGTITGAKAAPITGITGAAAEAAGQTAATGAEGFAAGVGIAKFVGVDLGTFLYGYFGACHP